MQTKWSYNPILINKARGALLQKMFLASIIVALMASFLAVPGVFAAPAGDDDPIEYGDLDFEWKNKLQHLRFENLFFTQVRFLPADFEDPDDLARANELLDKYGFALKQANDVVTAHTGFDKKGDVTNEKQAYESIQKLALYLHTMRGIKMKIDEEGYKISKSK